MADWDDEDFEPPSVATPAVKTDQWEGEDEDDDIKDNWDDDDDDNKNVNEETSNKPESGEPKLSKKKAFAKKLKEKEDAAAKAAEARRLAAEEAKTPEEKLADKLNAQKLAQESDLEVAKDTFGVNMIEPDRVTIDNCNPSTKEDFTQLEELISEKFARFESSPHYDFFLESLFRNACLSIDAESLKKIISSLSVLHSEKAKQERQKKAGKKKNKAKLAGGTKGGSKDEFADYSVPNDYDDFM